MANKVPALKDKTVAILLGKIERLYRQAKEDSGTPDHQPYRRSDRSLHNEKKKQQAAIYAAGHSPIRRSIFSRISAFGPAIILAPTLVTFLSCAARSASSHVSWKIWCRFL